MLSPEVLAAKSFRIALISDENAIYFQITLFVSNKAFYNELESGYSCTIYLFSIFVIVITFECLSSTKGLYFIVASQQNSLEGELVGYSLRSPISLGFFVSRSSLKFIPTFGVFKCFLLH